MKKEVIDKIKKVISENKILIDEPMKRHTSFRVGGPADILVLPADSDDIGNVIRVCNSMNVPYLFIGNGSNLLVGDKGIRSVVIKIADNYSNVAVDGCSITVEAGALLSFVSKVALKNELAGMEFASGIPGTVGGAVAMNAGAYGGEIKDILISAECIDNQGNVFKKSNEDLELTYRHSAVQSNDWIVLQAVFNLNKGLYEEIKVRMKDLSKRRREKQPLSYPSAGSTFKRPPGYYAGKLIQDAGLKGFKIGGAQVSELHCGFIINTGNASAKDILDLIFEVKSRVFESSGVMLETEIKIIGDF